MAYKRRYRRNKRRSKKNKMTIAKLDHRVTKMAKYLRPEVKHFYDATGAAQTFDYNGVMGANSFLPAQGVLANQRVGDQVYLLGCKFRITFTGSAAQSHQIRFGLFIDKENNLTALSDVLRSLGAAAAAAGGVTNSSYTAYKDVLWTMKRDIRTDLTVNEDLVRHYSMWIPIRRRVRFIPGTTNALGNAVKFFAVCNSNTNLPSFQFEADFMYTDI